MADITPNNKLITVDSLTIYHNSLTKYLSDTYITQTQADRYVTIDYARKTYLTFTDADNTYITKKAAAKKNTTPSSLNWTNAKGVETSLPFRTQEILTDSDDLDNITTYGVYQIYTASVPANVPLTGVNAILTVYNVGGGSQHVCQHYSTHTGYMFERYAQYSGGVLTWREWKQIATQIVQTLPADSDANKLGKTALYATSSSRVTNVPTSIEGNFTLLVYQGAADGNVTQVIYTHNTNNTHTGADKPCSVYVRDTNNFNNANPYWSAWTNLYAEANPSGEATGGALSKILINDVIYSVGGGGTGTVDTEMSDDSINAVQNKVIKSYVDATTENIVKIMPTSINKTNNKIYLAHDGDKLTGQTDIDVSDYPIVTKTTILTLELINLMKLAGGFIYQEDTTIADYYIYQITYIFTADAENANIGAYALYTDTLDKDSIEWTINTTFEDSGLVTQTPSVVEANPTGETNNKISKIAIDSSNYNIIDASRDTVVITADTILTTDLINKIVSAKSILVDGETDLYRLLENTTNTLVLQYMDATLYTITISWTLNQKWSEALSQDKQLLTSDDIQANPTATPTQELNKINIQGTVYSIPTGGGSSTVDTEMSDTSINAVENKVIKSYVDQKVTDAINTSILQVINANY